MLADRHCWCSLTCPGRLCGIALLFLYFWVKSSVTVCTVISKLPNKLKLKPLLLSFLSHPSSLSLLPPTPSFSHLPIKHVSLDGTFVFLTSAPLLHTVYYLAAILPCNHKEEIRKVAPGDLWTFWQGEVSIRASGRDSDPQNHLSQSSTTQLFLVRGSQIKEFQKSSLQRQ